MSKDDDDDDHGSDGDSEDDSDDDSDGSMCVSLLKLMIMGIIILKDHKNKHFHPFQDSAITTPQHQERLDQGKMHRTYFNVKAKLEAIV